MLEADCNNRTTSSKQKENLLFPTAERAPEEGGGVFLRVDRVETIRLQVPLSYGLFVSRRFPRLQLCDQHEQYGPRD